MMSRNEEIFQHYLEIIDIHLDDLISGRTDRMYELQDIAAQLFIHPTHLSTVIKQHTGHHPCFFYEQKIMEQAKIMLQNPQHSVADVAYTLTYDPSNFTKWFKAFAGVTPSKYRQQAAVPVRVAVPVSMAS
ncbi:AraC family transcriptional regulator [Chitinophaga sp. GbtcB8]|uniref:helix-turn-helix domain-containing protein n=1 Tax=Chitinophaga sp. GbtcB8 TaxID=2824753 RepID=UPI001C309B1F|nr:helix-turn-helix transcriptional regulator [Chitinophaga sp. GbtcB8]